MLRRALPESPTFLLFVGAGVALAAAFLLSGGRAIAGSSCWYGQIFMNGRPLLSAPSPAHVGDTITSTGGAWSTCQDEPFTGFYKEWLRDGVVIGGPDWVEGPPASFTYTIQAEDIGHEIRSAVSACDIDYGCYLPYAESSNAVIPGDAPPPPPPPPIDLPVAVHGHVLDLNGSPVAGASVALYRDLDSDGSVTQNAPLDRTTSDSDGAYVLRVAYSSDLVDEDGWANFAVEGTSGDVPYYAVAARRWNGNDTWLTPDQAAQVDARDPTYPVLPDDVELDPQEGASIMAGGGPDVGEGPCYAAYDETTYLSSELDNTVIGELHVAQDATGTFSYAVGNRADSYISLGINLGLRWHVSPFVFKHITRADSAIVAETNPSEDWAHRLLSTFRYAKYKHERYSAWTGKVCSTWYTVEPKEWWGGIFPGADESRYLHQCLTTYRRYMNRFGPNSGFSRSRYKLRMWGAGVTVGLGTGGLGLAARSGASARVTYRYHFGTRFQNHYLCGNDAPPARSTRVLAGG
jgi:hypothetical protein